MQHIVRSKNTHDLDRGLFVLTKKMNEMSKSKMSEKSAKHHYKATSAPKLLCGCFNFSDDNEHMSLESKKTWK